MPRAIVLTIARRDETNIVDLAEIGLPIIRGEVRVPESMIDEMFAEYCEVMQSDFRTGSDEITQTVQLQAEESHRSLHSIGERMFTTLLPSGVGDRLRLATPSLLYLHLDEQLLALPWECAHDGHSFLGCKFSLGRQVFIDDGPRPVSRDTAIGEQCRVLLVSDGGEEEPWIVPEMERLAAQLSNSGFADVTLLRGPVDKQQLLSALNASDIVHFAGQTLLNPRSVLDCGWSMQDGEIVQADLAELSDLPVLVWSESLGSVASGVDSAENSRQLTYGTSCSLLFSGIQNVITDCWPNRDTRDSTFAESFYTSLLTGATVGESLRQAREDLIARHGAGGASWARHCLYGDPQLAPFLDANSRAARRGRPSVDQKAERRQLTVMFCDLVDATKHSERLDPEDWRAVVRLWQKACAEIVAEYRGYVAQYLGDGILIYFGFPTAHENSAERAARAATDILRAMPRINEDASSLNPSEALKLRIGIHTGPVVIGEMGVDASRDFLAMGATPNVAARLQQRAEPNSTLVSDATYHLIHERFDCVPRAQLNLTGVSEPVNAYRIVAARQMPDDTGNITPFVGRQEELTALRERWDRARDGNGQVLLVYGDPGIGKSRIMREFNASVAGPGDRLIVARCSPLHDGSAHYPLIETLRRLFQFNGEIDDGIRLKMIETALQRRNFDLAETVPLIADLLSVDYLDSYTEPELSSEGRRQKLEETLVRWLIRDSLWQPLCFLVEDVQWVDPSTYSMLTRLVAEARGSPLFVIITFRPSPQVPWVARADLDHLQLDRLPRRSAEDMVRKVARGTPLADDVVQDVVRKTDGVPLFLEEYTRMAVERQGEAKDSRDDQPWGSETIPATLQDLLMERLDRLGDAKQVAQLASTIGRAFSFDVLKSVSTLSERALRLHLKTLIDAGLVFERGDASSDQFVFKHVMTRDAAYNSLLKGNREQIHRQIAERLESAVAKQEPELIAHHLTEAGETDKAVTAWLTAGQRQAAKSAHMEAIAHLTRAIDLLRELPASYQRSGQELEAQTLLASCRIATDGYGASTVETAYNRALELSRVLDDRQRHIKVLMGLEGFYFMRGNFQTAHQFADQALSLLEHADDRPRLSQAHWGLGCIFFHQGEFGLSQGHMQQSLDYYEPAKSNRGAVQDAKIMCLCYTAWGLWELGFPQKALDTAYKVMAYADELAHPFSQAEALDFAAAVHLFRRETSAARRLAEASIELCTRQGFPVWLALALVIRGRCLTKQGETDEGLAEMRKGIDLWASTGALVTRPYYLAQLAEGLMSCGRLAEARDVLSEALGIVDRTGERYFEAELTRLQGELYLAEEQDEDAENRFRRAVDIARRQGTLSLELRGAMSLSRLALRRGNGAEFREKLAGVVDQFTEGLDTKDLRDAKELIA